MEQMEESGATKPVRAGGGYGRGRGVLHMYAYWICSARETPIFSPEFPFRSISFWKNYPKNPFRSITILHFLADFAVPETIIFKISLNYFNPFIASHGRLSPRVSSRPERQPDASWQFRRLAFSRSKRIKIVPEPRIFTLDRELVPEPRPIFHFAAAHTYQNLGWVPPPPPPRRGRG